MIPQFPSFKKLEISDKNAIESYTKDFPPYSDYNFVSLWSWNTNDATEISVLNRNLVIKFQDYISSELFFSFLGKIRVEKTIVSLIKYAQSIEISDTLKFIPEVCIVDRKNLKDGITVSEDCDNFDYILSVDKIVNLKGNDYRAKRNFVNRFINNYHVSTKNLDIRYHAVQNKIMETFQIWAENKKSISEDVQKEKGAIQRLFTHASKFTLDALGIYCREKLVAFSIDEVVQDNYTIIHFEKADISYIGIFQYLKQQIAQRAKSIDCKYINYEQDLGIPGLKKAKLSWNPIGYLKKYTIQVKK